MNKTLHIAALVAFVIFTSVNAAPVSGATTALDINWSNCRNRSLELNRLAQNLALKYKLRRNVTVNYSDPPEMITAHDKCDPSNLAVNPTPCLKKMAVALRNYTWIFGKSLSLFKKEQESKILSEEDQVSEILSGLLDELKEPQTMTGEPWKDYPKWQTQKLQNYSVDRLYSFSILTARVFAAGNPANHTKGPIKPCA